MTTLPRTGAASLRILSALLLATPLAACEDDAALGPDAGERVDAGPIVPGVLEARLIAVGVHGAGAVRQVGAFLPQSPMSSNPTFVATTAAGEVLDPTRVLVASTSNFGAPLAQPDQLPGAIVSIDPARASTEPLVVPADFATSGRQAVAAGGAIRIYAVQSPSFLNSVYNPAALTAALPSVSNPLGISLNNAFGRPWFANAPGGGHPGTITVTDPDGRPLAARASDAAGGVFAGRLTNRTRQLIEGDLEADAVATAFLGASPDNSGRAVFAAVTRDGAVEQVHVEHGVDGVLPAGTISAGQGAFDRVGVVFNWVPLEVLFVTDPGGDAIVAVTLGSDGRVFNARSVARFDSPHFHRPVDVAPVIAERANPEFSSGTTLAAGSDLYVANRGSGTLVRMSQDGTVRAVRTIVVPGIGELGPDRVNGIATSSDTTRLWVTVSGEHPGYPGADGLVVEVPAFAPGTP